jgi:hypothetical protein
MKSWPIDMQARDATGKAEHIPPLTLAACHDGRVALADAAIVY